MAEVSFNYRQACTQYRSGILDVPDEIARQGQAALNEYVEEHLSDADDDCDDTDYGDIYDVTAQMPDLDDVVAQPRFQNGMRVRIISISNLVSTGPVYTRTVGMCGVMNNAFEHHLGADGDATWGSPWVYHVTLDAHKGEQIDWNYRFDNLELETEAQRHRCNRRL